jgi:hypothetical protein
LIAIFGKGKEMEKRYVKILVLAIGAMVLLAGALPCWAEEKEVEKEEESVWHEDEGRGGGFRRRLELTDEMIEHMMSRLAETEPAKAKELAKLREKDPEKFKAELREVMRERFGRRWGEHRKGGGRYGPGRGKEFGERGANVRGEGRPTKGRKGGRGSFGPAGGRGMGMMMRERHREFLEWLEKNYPEKAKELAELEEKNPELYNKRRGLCYRRYRKIYEAKENPALAKILTEDLELKEKRDKLLAEIRAGVNEDEKKELVKELEKVLGLRFDLIVKRKQIEYENLLKKLKELQERVKESEAQVEKWKEAKFKETSVKGRVEELVGKD